MDKISECYLCNYKPADCYSYSKIICSKCNKYNNKCCVLGCKNIRHPKTSWNNMCADCYNRRYCYCKRPNPDCNPIID